MAQILDFEGKTIVCVGIGNSGLDISVELSRVTKQVRVSQSVHLRFILHPATERGLLIEWERTVGRSIIILFADPVVIFPNCSLNVWWSIERRASVILASIIKCTESDRRAASLSRFRMLEIRRSRVSINDELPGRILCGAIKVKPNIRELTKDGVVFDDGTAVENVDAVCVSKFLHLIFGDRVFDWLHLRTTFRQGQRSRRRCKEPTLCFQAHLST